MPSGPGPAPRRWRVLAAVSVPTWPHCPCSIQVAFKASRPDSVASIPPAELLINYSVLYVTLHAPHLPVGDRKLIGPYLQTVYRTLGDRTHLEYHWQSEGVPKHNRRGLLSGPQSAFHLQGTMGSWVCLSQALQSLTHLNTALAPPVIPGPIREISSAS